MTGFRRSPPRITHGPDFTSTFHLNLEIIVTDDLATIRRQLEASHQQHLLKFYDELTSAEQRNLLQQISAIDFQQIERLIGQLDEGPQWHQMAARAQPPNAIRLNDMNADRNAAAAAGEAALRRGQVGLILVAGGQGTRLGFDDPKGLFPIGPVSDRSLFQVHLEKVLALGRRFGKSIPVFIMTSPATHDRTLKFMDEHDNFGVEPANLHIFCQGTMPAVSIDGGKILLQDRHKVFTAPNGHGGMLAALHDEGCLQVMQDRGLVHCFYCQVDNPLVPICDPLTIGFHWRHQSQLTTLACPKREPLQPVGNIVEIDQRVRIIEYSDLPDEIARQTGPDGSLKLWAGNIAVHVFEVEFLEQMKDNADVLPFHLARKKVPFIDESGRRIEPDEPNAIKFERFVFDLLPAARNALVVEVDPAEVFAPVKNASGAANETPETARAAMIRQARRMLQQCEVTVDPDVPVEINPLFASTVDELKSKLPEGTRIQVPTYWDAPTRSPGANLGAEPGDRSDSRR